ncbi:MAG TPA: hypothetical protein VHW47_09020 [Acidimicrobiales bacterium]|jgi:hypothetical protein|nr:hypothetical protein [Acidimicrobiales bacterium]
MDPADQAFPDGPPVDPEDWTDEQWLDWLKATDEADGAETPPVTVVGRATRSSGGAVLGQAMLGLANAMYGKKEEIVVIAEGDSTPEDDGPFAVRLDPDHPERSTVVIRPAAKPPG